MRVAKPVTLPCESRHRRRPEAWDYFLAGCRGQVRLLHGNAPASPRPPVRRRVPGLLSLSRPASPVWPMFGTTAELDTQAGLCVRAGFAMGGLERTSLSFDCLIRNRR